MGNMAIWGSVEKTDPNHTKAVNQRGGFTAISANYQIMRATEQFGPIGVGWGYNSGPPIFHDKFVIIPVTLWHGERAHAFGPAYGCAEILGNRPDSDAPKKATTDAITKLLSQLGFNADVFLGRYDDNKYLASVREEFKQKPEPEQTRDPRKIADSLLDIVAKIPDAKVLENSIADGTRFGDAWAWLRENDPPKAAEVNAAVNEARAKFGGPITHGDQDVSKGHTYQ